MTVLKGLQVNELMGIYAYRTPECHPEFPKRAQEGPRLSKTGPREPKMAQNDPKSIPKRPQEAPKRAKKAIPNRKTKKGPNQDDPKTVLDSPIGGVPPVWCHPRGSIWEAKSVPKPTPKRLKLDTKIQDEKQRSKTILDPSWSDLGSFWAPSWADLDLRIVLWPTQGSFFEKHFFRR